MLPSSAAMALPPVLVQLSALEKRLAPVLVLVAERSARPQVDPEATVVPSLPAVALARPAVADRKRE